MTRRLLVFDGDDTLWRVEPLYDEARRRARAVVADAGLPADRWEALERARDVANVNTFGVSAVRFPTSCVEAYEEAAHEAARPVDAEVRERVRAAARTAYEASAPLVPAVDATLAALSNDYTLVLLTKGDTWLQERRIDESGLGSFFIQTYIRPQKTLDEFREVLDDMNCPAESGWSIGNSLASDINPAISAGMHAIWIDAPVWEYERRERSPASRDVLTAKTLQEVPRILARTLSATAAAD